MKEDVKQKLYDAKMGLEDLLQLYPDKNLIQRRVLFALEAIDDAIDGKIKFPKKLTERKIKYV